MAKQKDNWRKGERGTSTPRLPPGAFSADLELVKTRKEITVKEIEDATGANRNTIKVHLKSWQSSTTCTGRQRRGARYTIK